MKQALILGLDIGTSGTKAVAFDTQGNTVAAASRRYPMAQPRPGWAEQSPATWWEAACACLRELTAQIDADAILSLGLSGQMHGAVLLDRDGAPTCPTILWCDTRTTAECAEIERTVGLSRLIAVTGNRALCNFTAPKLLWLKKHAPDALSRAATLLQPKDYIRYRLTGNCAAEPTDACGTLLYATADFAWSDELCTALGIDRQLLPPLLRSCAVAGQITLEASAATGLPVGLPVAAGAGDNAAAAVGVGAVTHGGAFTTIGTSGCVCRHTAGFIPDPNGRYHTYCAAVEGEWLQLGAIQAAGLALRWLHDLLGDAPGSDAYATLDREAAMLPPGSDGLFFLPYLLGERTPHLDDSARGCFIGLRPTHGRGAMARAVMEGVSFALCDGLCLIAAQDARPATMAVCGGGGASDFWRQMLADVFACPVTRPRTDEAAALGAALLGGVGVGLWPTIPAACADVCRTRTQTPPRDPAAYARIYTLWRTLYPALQDSFARIQQLTGGQS